MKNALSLVFVPALAALTLSAGIVPESQVRSGERLLLPAVNVPFAFKAASGKTLPAGVYDLEILGQGSNRILIGLLRNGQKQGELFGSLKGSKSWGDPHAPQGAGAPGGKPAADGSVRPGAAAPATFRDLGFQARLKSSFAGDGMLKIEPGVANGLVIEVGFPKAAPEAGKIKQQTH